ncbi:hypothetical protein C0581_01695 [Candidatus Parcubacteria bacterium]|nr:MAG: hypothetical protein C0581_01695 [Candidatus Parcubacteria bacterium]
MKTAVDIILSLLRDTLLQEVEKSGIPRPTHPISVGLTGLGGLLTAATLVMVLSPDHFRSKEEFQEVVELLRRALGCFSRHSNTEFHKTVEGSLSHLNGLRPMMKKDPDTTSGTTNEERPVTGDERYDDRR